VVSYRYDELGLTVGVNVDFSGIALGSTVPGDFADGFNGKDTLVSVESIIFTGTAQADTAVGTAGDDQLAGGGGNDSLTGGAGVDTAVFTGARTDYTVTYGSAGEVIVTDSVNNRDGNDTLVGVESLIFSDQTVSTNRAPTGTVTITGIAAEGQTLKVSNNVADADGIPTSGAGELRYQWTVGGVALSGATGDKLAVTQAQVGKAITVTAAYTDNRGFAEAVTSAPTALVANVNDRPVLTDASKTIALTAGEDAAQGVSGAVSATDADGDRLVYAVVGTAPTGVTVNADGTFTVRPLASDQALSAGQTRVVSFQVAASDGLASSDPAKVSVTIEGANDAPAASRSTLTATEDETLSGTLLGKDPDSSDVLAYSMVSAPQKGTVVVNTDGTFSYTPGANYSGADSFTFKVKDPGGLESSVTTVTLSVKAVNDAPVAQATSATTAEDEALSGSVSATDVDSSALTYSVVTGPANGRLTMGADGKYTFTPTKDFNSTDTFTFQASDGLLASATTTVTLTVTPVNDAPRLVKALPDSQGTATVALTPFEVLADAFIDVDGNNLTLTAGLSSGAALPAWLKFDAGTRMFSGTPTASDVGNLSVRVTASDGTLTASDDFLLAVNSQPNLASPAVPGVGPGAPAGSVAANEDTAKAGVLPVATDADVGDKVSYAKSSDPAHGTVTVAADGSYTYTPAAHYSGTDSFGFSVSDGRGRSTSYTMDVTVAPVVDTPTVTATSIRTSEDSIVALGPIIRVASQDVDGSETLTVTISGVPDQAQLLGTGNTAVPLTNGSASGISLAALAGMKFKPAPNASGETVLSVKVTAAEGGQETSASAPLSLRFSAVADAPTLTVTNITGQEDSAISLAGFTAALKDTDGSESMTLQMAVKSAATGVQLSYVPSGSEVRQALPAFDTGFGTVIYTMTNPSADELNTLQVITPENFNGDLSITAQAIATERSNGSSATSPRESFTVTVTPVADAPVLSVDGVSIRALRGSATDFPDIVVAKSNPDGAETLKTELVLTGLKANTALTDGTKSVTTKEANETVNVTGWDLTNLSVTPASDQAASTYTIEVRATAEEGAGAGKTSAITSDSVALTVLRPALQPTLTVTDLKPGTEKPEEAQATIADVAGGALSLTATPGQVTDVVTVIMTGLPSGAYLTAGGRNDAGTVFVLRPEDLAGLKLVVPAGADPRLYTLQISAFATDPTGGSFASRSGSLKVNVTANATDPLVIDLSKNGLLLNAVNSTLDVNNDGKADTSGWVGTGDDAVLFYSATANPSAPTKGNQLFSETYPGNTTGTSFGALALIDGNADGVISGSELSTVYLVKGNGTVQSAAEAGIKSISLSTSAYKSDGADSLNPDSGLGSTVVLRGSTAELTTGDTVKVAEVAFSYLQGGASKSDSVKAPVLTATAATGVKEDAAEGVAVTVGVTADAGTTTVVTVTGAGKGSLSAGAYLKDSDQWVLTADQLVDLDGDGLGTAKGFKYYPAADKAGQIGLTLVATSSKGSASTTGSTVTALVDVSPLADTPTLNVAGVTGNEDATSIPIEAAITAKLSDTDGSERLSVTISDVPSGWTLQNSAGTITVSGGSAELQSSQLAGLALKAPANFGGSATLKVKATASEMVAGTVVSTQDSAVRNLSVTVTPVADAPTLTAPSSVSVKALGTDKFSSLTLTSALADTDGSETLLLKLEGVPLGVAVKTGTAEARQTLSREEDGSYTLLASQLSGLGLELEEGASVTGLTSAGTLPTLTITSTSKETAGGNSQSTSKTISMARLNSEPSGTVTVSGTPTQGQALTASNTLADADGLGTISYQWKAGGVNIAGATASTYTLTSSEVGKAISVTASYTDGFGSSEAVASSGTSNVQGISSPPPPAGNAAPVASAGGLITAEDTKASGTLIATDSDSSSLTFRIVTPPSKGTVTLGANGGYTYTPAANYNGLDSFGFRANDGTSDSATATMSIIVSPVNDAPVVATPLVDQSITTGTTLSYVMPASTFTDVDNPTLTYTAARADGSALPSWLSFNAGTRTFSGTPVTKDAGTITVKVTASDGSLSASDEFVVKVAQASYAASGVVQDGYVAGATLFVDRNGNGRADADEDTGLVTDSAGVFKGTVTGNGPLIAVGGTNVDTGLRNTLNLTAPQGAAVISPVTTLVQTMVSNQGLSVAQAQTQVSKAFGISGVDLLTFDPLNAGDTPQGLAVQKVNAQVALTATLAGDASAVLSGIARVISQSAAQVDLASSSAVAAVTSGLILSAAQQSAITQGNSQVKESNSLVSIAQAQQTTVVGSLPASTDWVAPKITGFSPEAGATNVALASDLTFTFDETIQRGAGAITLRTADGTVVQRFETGSASVSVQGNKLTVNPSADLAPSTGYGVTLDPGSVKDAAGNSFVGSANQSFSTISVPGDVTAPLATKFVPSDSARAVTTSSNLAITFNELIQSGGGAIRLKTADGKLVETFTTANAIVSGSTLTLNPTADLAAYTRYVVELDAGAVKDLAGNANAATNNYDFRTASVDGLYHMFVVAFAAAPGVTYMSQLAEAWNHYNGLPPRASDGAGALQQIVEIFTTKPQFTSVYAQSLTNRELATQLVNRVVKTSATEAARTEAINDIEAALGIGWSRGKVLYTVFGNLANKALNDATWGATAQQFQNQLAVARYFTEEMAEDSTDLARLQGVLANVTPETDVSTTDKIVQIIGTVPPGG
jgi:VCBS repeat-containing protein